MNPLQEYARKRNFKKTKEPPDRLAAEKSKNLIFVVQEHHASHLHYDFRLELDGVLKSWAVPKGPSMKPSEKRLAVEVEDHPLSYANFTGRIPKGEYGGGEVYRWDMGTWEPIGDPHEGLKKGRLSFSLKGKKLKGEWLLIRTQRSSGKKHQWLLMKRNDSAAMEKTSKNFIEPQLAFLVDHPPEGNEWVHEVKFDGYRIQAYVGGRSPKLITRAGNDWTAKYPPVEEALRKIKAKNTIIDGEVVAVDEKGRSDFQILQNAMNSKNMDNLLFYVFDILFLDGKDLRELPLMDRKEALKELLEPLGETCVRFVEALDVSGGKFLEKSCKLGLEGVVSKRKDGPYISGRHESWLKSKCKQRQEFVIGGYTDPQGARKGFGALLLGVYEDDQSLRYVGKVGTGFDVEIISGLIKKLQSLEQEESPFDEKSPRGKGLHWVNPKLVAEVSFSNWTQDQILRVPVYEGLREDKPSKEIHIEKVKTLEMSHKDKVLYEEEGLTKEDVASYYRQISEFMLPHIDDRPLSLLRCPNGSAEKCFYQKHYKEGSPEDIHCITVKEKTKTECYVSVDSEEGIQGLVQMGSLEIHAWNSREDSLEKPDQIVMDFDPGPGVPWKRVIEAALDFRGTLETLKLKSFVKVTGGKGLHVHVPIAPIYSWEQVQNFTKTLAIEMAERQPKIYVSEMSKKLRDKKIFVDYLRNTRGATAVAPYSLRAKAISSVAMPLEWEEIADLPSAAVFTLEKALAKIKKRKRDPWMDYFKTKQKISLLKGE
jgi:bifunctional non-homologous end joining protein LigD